MIFNPHFKKSAILSFAVIAVAFFQSCSSENTEKDLQQGKALLDSKNYQGALEKFNIVIHDLSGEQKADAYYRRALAKEGLGDVKGAVSDYTASLEIDKKNYESWHNRGILKDNLGDHNGAIEDYTQAILLDKFRYEAFLNRGVAYSKLLKNAEARREFQHTVELNPNFARAWYFLAITKGELRDSTGGCQDAQKAVQLGFAEAQEIVAQLCGQKPL